MKFCRLAVFGLPIPVGYPDAVCRNHTLTAVFVTLGASGRLEALPPGALGFEHRVVHFVQRHLRASVVLCLALSAKTASVLSAVTV